MTAALAKEAYAAPTAELAACAADLVACGSLEMSPDRVSEVRTVAALLPVGTKVYVNHLPRHALAGSLPTLNALREAGLEPVPHVAARRVLSRPELRSFLERAVGEAGVTKVLLIGGDDAQARGPYVDAAAVLRDGVVAECGVREVGLPGYPEGHPRIAAGVLQEALEEKITLAAEQGLGTYMVTQFSFAPARVIEYCTSMARERPTLPVYVGLAGPTEPRTLLRFAQRCGVSASLRALKDQGMAAVRLVTHTDPGEQLAAVARYCLGHTSCNVVGVHLFSFGGAAQAAGWMRSLLASRLG
jgi:methylenetetrahydrofolate reductase (NADPH)